MFTEHKMSMENEDKTAFISNTHRPLPPTFKILEARGAFHGMADPGSVVTLLNRRHNSTRQAITDDDGIWVIAGPVEPVELLTVFEIWASDPSTGVESDRIQFTFHGSKPVLSDIHVSRTLAFGLAPSGTEVIVYGAVGQVLGKSYVFGTDGPWSVTFNERLDIADKVCIVAKLPNNNSDSPEYRKASAFSVDERNIRHISGSGADSGESIQLFYASSDSLIAETVADDCGAWSFDFTDALKSGARISIKRLQKDGAVENGPVITVSPGHCLAPEIDMISGTELAGIANPGLIVIARQSG